MMRSALGYSNPFGYPYGRGSSLPPGYGDPDDLVRLRRQAQEIEDRARRAARRHLQDLEREQLRRRIRAAGEVPCC